MTHLRMNGSHVQTKPMPYRAIAKHSLFVGASFAFLFHEEFHAATLALASLWLSIGVALVHMLVIFRDRARAAATMPPTRTPLPAAPRGELPAFTLLTFHGMRPNGESVPFSLDVKGEEIVLAVQHTN